MANKQFAHAKLTLIESFRFILPFFIILLSKARRIVHFVGHEENHIWSENLVLGFPLGQRLIC